MEVKEYNFVSWCACVCVCVFVYAGLLWCGNVFVFLRHSPLFVQVGSCSLCLFVCMVFTDVCVLIFKTSAGNGETQRTYGCCSSDT